MRYKRSSFITWLTTSCYCDVFPLKNNPKILIIKYLNETSKMYVTPNNVIDYEEIYLHYQRLMLPYLPGDKDLEKIDE